MEDSFFGLSRLYRSIRETVYGDGVSDSENGRSSFQVDTDHVSPRHHGQCPEDKCDRGHGASQGSPLLLGHDEEGMGLFQNSGQDGFWGPSYLVVDSGRLVPLESAAVSASCQLQSGNENRQNTCLPHASPLRLVPPLSTLPDGSPIPVVATSLHVPQDTGLAPHATSTPITTHASDGTRVRLNMVDSKTPSRNTSKLVLCHVCRMPCKNQAGLASHLRAKHPNGQLNISGKKRVGGMRFSCFTCPKKFISKRARNAHRKKCCPLPVPVPKKRKTACTKKPQSELDHFDINTEAQAMSYDLVNEVPGISQSTKDSMDLAKASMPDLSLDPKPQLEEEMDIGSGEISGLTDSILPQTPKDSQGIDLTKDIIPESLNHNATSMPPTGITTRTCLEGECVDTQGQISSLPNASFRTEYSPNLQYLNICLASRHLVPLQVRGDGHCIVNAVSVCLMHTPLALRQDSDTHTPASLLDGILREVKDHHQLYDMFTDDDVDMLSQVEKYVRHKDYMNSTASFIPNVIANMLNINIRIVTQYMDSKTNAFDVSVIPPGRDHTIPPKHTIHLLRTGTGADAATHYQSLVSGKQMSNLLQPIDQGANGVGKRKMQCKASGQKYLLFRSPSYLSNFFRMDDLVVSGQEFNSNEQNIQARRFPFGHAT